jgi:alkanesulfonate monooxygenase SsuD/methylene tetrahydromethanopterin reductase-like flavin-dependent oxidoreductase (luciferase family)
MSRTQELHGAGTALVGSHEEVADRIAAPDVLGIADRLPSL